MSTQAVCNSFKTEILTGKHAFATSVVRTTNVLDTFKGALYLTTATLGKDTTAYSSTNEVSGVNYTTGGVVITNATAPVLSGNTACWTPSASIALTTVTLATAFDTLLLYNNTQANAAVAVYTFGTQIITAGNFTLTMPANVANTALLQIS